MKPRRFNGGGSVSGSEGSRVNIGAGAKGSTRGAPDSDMGPRIEKANKRPELPDGAFDPTKGAPPDKKTDKEPVKKPVRKMRGGGMVKKNPVRKMRGGGMVKKKPVPKKMRGGGMVKKPVQKMRGGGMVKKK
tara:strand:+ start:4055 stop:4450 length:396 start_codon:yes stop_codon:yes gene_type:complete